MARSKRRAATDSSTRSLLVSLALVLVAMVAIAYAPVFGNDFVNFDDPQYVTENPQVQNGLTWRGVLWALTAQHAGNWHPLTWLSHTLDVQLFGMNAGAHHLMSVVIHGVNTLLLYAVLRRMTGAVGRSAFVAALFAVHPLHVESVAWVAERKDVLSTLFALLTLHLYCAWVSKPGPLRYASVVLLFALGLSAKPMLVTLPFLLLLLDYWPLGRFAQRSFRQLAFEKVPLFVLALASSLVTYAVQQQSGAVKGLDALPLGQRLSNALVAYVVYLGQTVWPVGLAAIYPYRVIPMWQSIAAFVVIAAVSIAVIYAAKRYPHLPVGWFWYLGALVPVIGLVQVGSQPMADRYTYIPSIGVFIILAWGISELVGASKYRNALPLAASVVVLACTIATRAQVGYWKDSVTLWEHALAVTNDNYRAENNLAHALTKQGRLTESVPHYSEALRLKPENAEAHNNLGHVLSDLGKTDEAIAHYREAVRLIRDFEEAHNNLGVALAGRGRSEEAITHFAEALRLKPGLVAATRNLALTRAARGSDLADQGKLDEAVHELEEAVRLKPDEADFQYDLAVLLFRKGRTSEAVGRFEEAVRLNPNHSAARDALQAIALQGKKPR